jgi:hypothetical protein
MSNLRNGALRLLAESADGCTADSIVVRGFTLELLMELIVAGLATTQTEQVGRASQPIGRTRFRITEAGRRALTLITGARYQIAVDGQPRSNRDSKAIAIEAAEYLKYKHPHAEVTVPDRVTGDTTTIKMPPPGRAP